MKTSIFRRGISGLLAVLMTFTALMGIGTTTAFAASTAGETAESYSVGFPRDGDANLDYSGTWGGADAGGKSFHRFHAKGSTSCTPNSLPSILAGKPPTSF